MEEGIDQAHRNGHIQAVGTDVAGRRQYMYHLRWQQERAEEKFDHILEMLREQLPEWRRQYRRRSGGARGSSRDRVLALALHLLDRGYFRAGGEQYAEEHESYGPRDSAVRSRHRAAGRRGGVRLSRQEWGAPGVLEIEDAEVVRAVRSLLRRDDRTERLLVCRTARVGPTFTPTTSTPDSRNWWATTTASRICERGTARCWRRRHSSTPTNRSRSGRVIKRVESAVMKEVSEALGNTPAVARGSLCRPARRCGLRARA